MKFFLLISIELKWAATYTTQLENGGSIIPERLYVYKKSKIAILH